MRKTFKKFLSILMIMMLMIVSNAISVKADLLYSSNDDFMYTLENDGTTYILSYIGSDTEVIIPDKIDGRKVVGIFSGAFSECTNVTNIEIPSDINKFGNNAFEDTTWYKEIYDAHSNGVVYINNVAYSYKGDIPDNTKIILKDGTTGIADGAFGGCDFVDIKISDTVTYIGEEAFCYCYNLENVNIPNSVTEIDNMAFADTGLTSITIPENVLQIGVCAFGYYDEDPDELGFAPVKIEGFIIKGYTGTSAETYANDNGFEFVALDTVQVVSGDADANGVVNARDRMTLTRYLAKWSGYETIDSEAADVNDDGVVNAKDRMILTRHLAKWNGYETIPFNK